MGLAFPLDDHTRTDVERPHIVSGRAPHPDAPFEIVVGETRSKVLGVTVGGDLHLETYTQEQIDEQLSQGQNPGTPQGPKLTLHVVGLERGPRQVITDQETENDFFPVTPAFLRTVSPLPGVFANALIVRVPDEANVPAIVKRITNTPSLDGVQAEFTNDSRVVDATDLVAQALYVFALLSAVCGAIALALFFARRASTNVVEDETLAAMGVTRNELRVATVIELLPALVLGALGAVVVAGLVSLWMPFGLAGRIEPDPGFDLDWSVILPGTLLLFAAVLVVTLAVVWRTIGTRRRESRHTPFATRLVEGVRVRPAPAAGVRMALERGRGARAVPVGLALAGSALVIAGIAGALTFGASLQRIIDEPSARGRSWDVEATDPTGKAVLAHPDIESATLTVNQTITINDTTVEARGLKTVRGEPPDMFIEGRAPVAEDEVALGRETRRAMHVSTGDVVRVVSPSGPVDLRVVGTAVFSGMSDDPILGEGAVLTFDGLDRLVRPEDAKPGETLEAEGNADYAVTFKPGAETRAALDRLNAELNQSGFGADEPRTPAELRRLRDVRALPFALALFIGLLGAIAVGYGFVTAVQRRRADIAMHKALGMTRRGVRVIVLTQATTTVLVGILIGVPLGIVIARSIWRFQSDNLGVRFVVVAPALLLAAVCLAALVLANVTSLLPARRAVRMRAATVLRTE
jgi:hypothetical protein